MFKNRSVCVWGSRFSLAVYWCWNTKFSVIKRGFSKSHCSRIVRLFVFWYVNFQLQYSFLFDFFLSQNMAISSAAVHSKELAVRQGQGLSRRFLRGWMRWVAHVTAISNLREFTSCTPMFKKLEHVFQQLKNGCFSLLSTWGEGWNFEWPKIHSQSIGKIYELLLFVKRYNIPCSLFLLSSSVLLKSVIVFLLWKRAEARQERLPVLVQGRKEMPKVCDKIQQCADGSDEGGECGWFHHIFFLPLNGQSWFHGWILNLILIHFLHDRRCSLQGQPLPARLPRDSWRPQVLLQTRLSSRQWK